MIRKTLSDARTIIQLKRELEEKKIYVKYSTFSNYVRTKIRTFEDSKIEKGTNYLNRRDIINYILNWKYDSKIIKFLNKPLFVNKVVVIN